MERIHINNTNLARQIRKNAGTPDLDGKKKMVYDAKVGTNRYGKDCFTTAYISKKGCSSRKKLVEEIVFNSFDFIVLDAIYTLYVEDYESFSYLDILKTITADDNITATPKRKTEIYDSISKMTSFSITIDATQEAMMKGLIGSRSGDFEAENKYYYGSSKFLSVDINYQNGVAKSFSFSNDLCPIPLYKYTLDVNKQIITVPEILLKYDMPDGNMSNTTYNILMKRYIISRIEAIRNSKNSFNERRIRYGKNAMLDDIGIFKSDYTERSYINLKNKINSEVVRLLEYYKKIGYIEGYEVIRKAHGEIHGVKIVGDVRNPKCLMSNKTD